MVGPASQSRVETIDQVRAGDVALVEVGGAIGFLAAAADDFQRGGAVVAGEALLKRAASATAAPAS